MGRKRARQQPSRRPQRQDLPHRNLDAESPAVPERNSIDEGPLIEPLLPEDYVRERALLIDMEQKSADQHDKAILNLAMAALGGSITFMQVIAPTPVAGTLWLVRGGWIFLAGSILTILVSFLSSQWACQQMRQSLDDIQSGDSGETKGIDWSKWTHRFNVVSFSLFGIGVCLLVVFSICNFPNGDKQSMSNSSDSERNRAYQQSKDDDGRGAIPPRRPVVAQPSPPSTPKSGQKPTK